MQQADLEVRKNLRPQVLVQDRRGFEVQFGGFFDQGIDDVGLAAEFDLAFDSAINACPLVFADDNGFDRRSAWGRSSITDNRSP